MSSLLVTSPPHLARTRRLFCAAGSDGMPICPPEDHVNRKFPVEVALTLPMKFQALPLFVEYSSVIGASVVVSMGSFVRAFVSVPVMLVLPLVLAMVDGLRLTVASVGVG